MTPEPRHIYAIKSGSFAGEMWIYCGDRKKKELCYNFLSIPIMENRSVEKEIFENGFENGVVEFVEKVPKYVYKISKKQYDKNEKSTD